MPQDVTDGAARQQAITWTSVDPGLYGVTRPQWVNTVVADNMATQGARLSATTVFI